MLILVFVGSDVIVPSNLNEINSIKNQLEIFQADENYFIAYISKTDFDVLNSHLKVINIRQALMSFDQETSHKIIYYLQWVNYARAHKFCGICGAPLVRQDHSRFMLCTHCNHEAYPKLSPCVIVRITRGDEILLARGATFPPNVWALIAGFVELGESLEEALRREIMEEVGITVDNIRYWGSQSWPIPTSSLMIAFTADYQSGEVKVDGIEIDQAGFFTKDNIPGIPPTNFSIASKMIEEFIHGKT
jgi:NAD+ diphosphatase